MLLKAGLFLLCLLWALLCLRFYTLISRDNVWQRRFIALGAGLGAGLIYILGSMILTLLRTPSPAEMEREVQQVEDVRVQGR
ncbi:hypothetical protein SAMN02745166_03536 [Prosthecobacter debontii]|uniref:Uncharacterized protein n=1 Tax=Prosthecobacter debontii TaxID=48467 RepID=A0A1T4YLD9_9BACT|nr:hypothetical protein [Prosthecobacter debontii]SKB02081.1 hypothetical protein SAMN02745166_03536 [Prosthecobacter debontii]